ncbi:MAG: hypothetical protein ACQEQ7_05620 [Thermodesulfobacteriota bacterium]
MIWILLSLAPFSMWTIMLFLPWRPWGTQEYLDAEGVVNPVPLTQVTVLIPARNEAGIIGTTLRFYGLSMGWALGLPLIGTLYLSMTWISAIRFWQGAGARWKGRAYGSRGE